MTKLVFINPGHSKNCNPDPGATGNGYKEADVAYKIAVALSEKLKSIDIDCIVYQQSEGSTANAQLNQIPKKANVSSANLFLSIHLNSAANSSAKGTETLYHRSSIEGKKFAELVNQELAKSTKDYTLHNRGAKEDVRNLLVLRATNMPSALTEIGFISNKNEINWIVNNIEEIASRLCIAVCKYFGIEASKSTKKCINFKLEPVNDKYNCYVNDELKLKENKLSTCLLWINENYA